MTARRSEGHVAVAFGDAYHHEHWQELRVFLDERDVTNDCIEADADEGWVLLIHKVKRDRRREPFKVQGAVRIEGVVLP